ncbi:serine/threonine protein kinase [Gilvimarinus agarilyticus]|uniref:serine/threonine-protein kinase n=1 Tax=Gilvimarinus sp. 2_MG-2023 TaxID=3062666 RepID=UPI001C09DF71|nr:serine/threonine-protein kinase [Gilvimarinus sp. 2_MG-2023]MBU2884477.1 serine/threonine protein kinase [Gilvimarinus agarilyticus]MDO6569613.1 serine/threonine-protein kinase [Gilvimarinus sp. 2_MG-2023]
MDRDQDKTVISDQPEPAKAPATQKFGHYEVVAELGRGGMGTVYRGYESSLNRYVAIKVLAPHLADDESLVGRFSREAKSVAALNHPNVVHIYYTGEQEGLPYFVMECIEGETLADRVREKGTLSSQEAAKLLLQAARGLACAHDRGIIHRDVKPSNLMIDASDTVKLTDFGIALARDIGDKLTTTGQFVGTTGYVSPEVFQGRTVDSRSDIFSLGVVLFEMLAGVKPFDHDSPMGLMLQVVEKPAPDIRELNPSVDLRLQTILQRMIEKDPANRYQTCHELSEDLSRFLADQPLAGEPTPSAQLEPSAPARRSAWPLLLLFLVGAGAAAYTWRGPLLEFLPVSEPAGPQTTAPAVADMGLNTAVENTDSPDGVVTAGSESIAVVAPTEGAEATDKAAPAEGILSAEGTMPTEDSIPAKEEFSEKGEVATPSGEPSNQLAGGQSQMMGDSAASMHQSPAALNQSPPSGNTMGAVDDGESLVGAMAVDNSGDLALARAAQPSALAPQVNNPSVIEAQSKPVVNPEAAMVATRGDAALVGPLAQRIDEILNAESIERLDPAFVSGAQQALQAPQPDLNSLKQPILASGGRYLVLVTASSLGGETIEYYGQYDTLYSAQVEVVLYDLVQTRSLRRWSERVSYTNLNAQQQVDSAFSGHLASLPGLMDAP